MDGEENRPKKSRQKKKARQKRIAKFYSIESLRLLYYRQVEVILTKIYKAEKELVEKIMTFRMHKIFANVCVCAIILSAIALPFLRGEVIVAGDGGGNHEAVNPIDPTPIEPPTPPVPTPPPYFDNEAIESAPYESIYKYNHENSLSLLNLNVLDSVDTCFLYQVKETHEDAYLRETLEYIDMDVGAWDFLTFYAVPSEKDFTVFKNYEELQKNIVVKGMASIYDVFPTGDDMFPVLYQAAFEYDGIRYFMDIKTSMPEDVGNRLEDYLNILIPDNN